MNFRNPLQGTRTVKALMLGAETHAHAMGDRTAGAEHLLLSAFDLPGFGARRAFVRAGGDPDGFEAAIAHQHEQALRGLGVEPVPDEALGPVRPGRGARSRFNESAIATVRRAAKHVEAGRPDALGPWVVAAVAEMRHGTAARTLRSIGIDAATLAAAARAEAQGTAR